jgi:hypothetical protein
MGDGSLGKMRTTFQGTADTESRALDALNQYPLQRYPMQQQMIVVR